MRDGATLSYCDDQSPKDVFTKPGATHFVVADFSPLCEASSDTVLGRQAANAVERLVRDHLVGLGAAPEDDLAAAASSVEVYRLRCAIKDGTEAQLIGRKTGADLVLWGTSSCPVVGGSGQPLVQVITNQTLTATSGGTVVARDINAEIKVPDSVRKLQEAVAGSFCVHAAMTAPRMMGLAGQGSDKPRSALLETQNLDLPQVVGGDAYGLTLFVGGLHFYRQGQLARALGIFRKASEHLHTDSRSAADLVAVFGETEAMTGALSPATKLYERCEGLATEGSERWWVCRTRHAELRLLGGDLPGTEQLLKKTLGIRGISPAREARTREVLGDLHFRTARLADAETAYNDALALFQKIEDRLGEANARQALGELYLRTARLANAEIAYDAALVLYQAVEDRLGEANTRQALGDLYVRTARLGDAETAYNTALALFQKVEARLGEANTRLALGRLYILTDRLADAETAYNDALVLYRKMEARVGEANTRRALGDLYVRTTRLADAETAYNAALELFQKMEDRLGEANARQALGDLYVRTARLADAETAYNEALVLYRKVEARLGEANTQNGLGRLLLAQNRPVEALRAHRAALSMLRDIREVIGEAGSLGYMARAALAAGDTRRATALGALAWEALVRLQDRFGQRIALVDLAQSLSQLDDEEGAFAAVVLAWEAARAIRDPKAALLEALVSREIPDFDPNAPGPLLERSRARLAASIERCRAALRDAKIDPVLGPP